MNATRVSYTLDSTLDSVNRAEHAAAEQASKAGFSAEECSRIAMAVREATVNAVLHGNQYDPDKRVTLSFAATPGTLTVAVRDEGPGLDPASISDPLAPENLLRRNGRGIFLIRAFMDEIHIHALSPGTEITMTKFVRAPHRADKEHSQ
jgi:serine/threonine-protein kinase RsbW